MNEQNFNQVVAFIWNIACDCLVNTYNKGDYRKVILPMIVIRRFDALLEDTKPEVLAFKQKLDAAGITDQDRALATVAKQSFSNSSPFTLRDLKARTKQQQLKVDFENYLNGFSTNVQLIIDKFEFRNQIGKLSEGNILGLLIEKLVDPKINLSNRPILNDDGSIRLPALDNHTMGTIFEELLRRFNEENNVTEAGEHFTPRDVVELMTDLAFIPIADTLTNNTYLIYDGACGTGGILSQAETRMKTLAETHHIQISTMLYGQELQPETFATAQADMLIKGEGAQAENIKYGSTISQDQHPKETFDFLISNPPFGTPWKKDLEIWGFSDKKEITDSRFVFAYGDDPEFSIVPNIGDPQMLFLANNISKMKHKTKLGSRIVEVHNGSSLFTGSAGQGESNLRRYLFENDLVEAIVALPENMFYNTGIATFLWIIANKKSAKRKGKVQLIDATNLKSPLRKNLGKKNCELTEAIRQKIMFDLYLPFKETAECRIFDNNEFGYWEVTVERPLRLRVKVNEETLANYLKEIGEQSIHDAVKAVSERLRKEKYELDYPVFYQAVTDELARRKVKMTAAKLKQLRTFFTEVDETAAPANVMENKNATVNSLYGYFAAKGYKHPVGYESDKDLRDKEQIPLNYPGGIAAFFANEVLPFAPDAWIDEKSVQIGYEVSFTKYFYQPIQLRELSEIVADLRAIEAETDGLLGEILEMK